MKRDINQISRNNYDVLIIGGGIYGAWAAYDAALRGLSVAIVDKGDFGSATSSNSLKIIHGGLRYLQHADFRRMRQSIHERMVLMRVAPHLIHPLPFLMPTYGHFMQSKEIMRIALTINDLISFDQNRLMDSQKHIPPGRVISRGECLQIFPGVDNRGLTGGAVWYDCQIYNSERMILSILRAAQKAGADLANYVEVVGFLQNGSHVIGVKAKDVLADEKLDIQARIVVNASGPWMGSVLSLLYGYSTAFEEVLFAKAINLVVKRQLIPKYAVSISCKSESKDNDAIISRGTRLFFIVPWRDYSLIGTTYIPYYDDPSSFKVTEKDIQDFIVEINQAYPFVELRREEVSFFHGGLVPIKGQNLETGNIELAKKYRIHDHMKDNGIEGLISVVGVKYTTARAVAEETVDLVFKKLGRKPPMCLTAITPVYGGRIEKFNGFLSQEIEKRLQGLSTEVIKHLVYNYGSEYPRVVKYIDENPKLKQTVDSSSRVIKAEVIYGIREEMAQRLIDIVLRRTELGSAGNPGENALRTCASIMAAELKWDEMKIQRELDEVRAAFSTGN